MDSKERDFDKEAASWDQNPGRTRLAEDIAGAIKSAVKITPDMNALDFGCGTGLLTLQIQPLVHTITGVDNSQGMLDVLESKVQALNLNNVHTQHRDLIRGDSLQGSYDLILSSMAFHHIREIGPVLYQLSQALLPGGHLCIADLDLDDGMFHSDNEGVFHSGFDRPVLRQAFMGAGLVSINDLTAASVEKPVPGCGTRLFTVFLMTGRKPG